MSRTIEVRVPAEPDCWESCATCRADTLTVVELLTTKGDPVDLYQPLAVLEVYKTELEVVSPSSGTIAELLVVEGDEVEPGELLALIAPCATGLS